MLTKELIESRSRLSGLRVYLSGACENAKNSGGDWRKKITPFLSKLGMTIFDPVHSSLTLDSGISKSEEFEYVKDLRTDEKYEELTVAMKNVLHLDCRMVDSADCLICKIDPNVATFGTTQEIVIACQQKKPVYIFCPSGKRTIPLWFFGLVPHNCMFPTMGEIVEKFHEIAYCDEKDLEPLIDRKRWLFLNKIGN